MAVWALFDFAKPADTCEPAPVADLRAPARDAGVWGGEGPLLPQGCFFTDDTVLTVAVPRHAGLHRGPAGWRG